MARVLIALALTVGLAACRGTASTPEHRRGLVGIDRATTHLKGWISDRGGSRASRSRPAKPADDPVTVLDRMADLRDRGAMTAEEYEAKKAELLGRM